MLINLKKDNKVVMKKILITPIILIISISMVLILIYSCDSKYSKNNHINTLQLENHLYYEIYKITSGGALASNTYSYYLTDSLNFREYVGTIYYDDEQLRCKSLDNTHVLVYKVKRKNLNDTLEKKVYIISELQKKGNFD